MQPDDRQTWESEGERGTFAANEAHDEARIRIHSKRRLGRPWRSSQWQTGELTEALLWLSSGRIPESALLHQSQA